MMYSQAVQMQQNVPLAPLTTLRLGGPARFFTRVETESDLLEATGFARSHQLPLFLLGGGSNLLVADAGFDGLVIQIALGGTPTIVPVPGGDAVFYTVPAGHDWDAFVLETCRQGLAGVECMAGIPGLVGGTPVQNVGAYGQEVADTIAEVRVLDLETGSFHTFSAAECEFAYRRSRFNSSDKGRYVVTAVTFRLERGGKPKLSYGDLKSHFARAENPPTLLEVYDAVRSIRYTKGMLLVEGEPDCRSAGSFFKNPIVGVETIARLAEALDLPAAEVPNWPNADGQTKLPAAWLVQHAGFYRGYALGAAGISSRHTLALINRGGATQADIVALRDRIQKTVLDRFGIRLEQEPVTLP